MRHEKKGEEKRKKGYLPDHWQRHNMGDDSYEPWMERESSLPRTSTDEHGNKEDTKKQKLLKIRPKVIENLMKLPICHSQKNRSYSNPKTVLISHLFE